MSLSLIRQLLLVSCLLLTFHPVARAQYNTKSEWYVGVNGGATLSNITLVPKLVDKQFAFGRTGGVVLRFVSEPHFGLQTELNYLEAGWEEHEKGTLVPYSYRRNLNMVDVPFLLHAYTGDKTFRGILNLGPRFSYLLSETETFVDGVTPFIHHGKPTETPFQYGILGGGGFELHLGRLVFGLEGRYIYYLSNLFADAVKDDFSTSNVQVITVNAFLHIQLHK